MSKIQSVTEIQVWKIELPTPIVLGNMTAGFDPGSTHMGFAWNIEGLQQAYVMQIDKHRTMNPIERMKEVYGIFSEMITHAHQWDVNLTIEGASFSDKYRQVELAEIRATVAWWAMHNGVREVQIVPPLTIRKAVFGNAKLKAHDVWDNHDIPNDALAALSCMYYGQNA